MSEKLTISELREICQGGKKRKIEEYYYFCRFFSRKISIYLTKLFLMLNVSANTITIMSFFVMVLALILLLFNGKMFLVASGLLLILVTILDCNDGEVSRFRKKTSNFGGFMDSMMADYFYGFFFIFLGFSIFKNSELLITPDFLSFLNLIPLEVYLLLGGLISVFKLLDRISSLKIRNIKRLNDIPSDSVHKGEFSLFKLFYIIEINVFTFAGMMYHLFFLSALVGIIHIYILFYFSGFTFLFLSRSWVHYKLAYKLDIN
jgi:phosphatidylglycerophosphate synthase